MPRLCPELRGDDAAREGCVRRRGAAARHSGAARARDPGGSGEVTTAGRHWPEYVMEGALLGLFMMAACGFATPLEHPASPLHVGLPDESVRRLVMGLAMGATAIALIHSP